MASKRIEHGQGVAIVPAAPGADSVGLSPRAERADAVRNRGAILEAARGIVGTEGAQGLVMSEVARAAGVGVGTLYRRFGDRAGLAYALLDESGKAFQAALLYGPPPLGPGAPPLARIQAFLHACVDDLEAHLDLWLIAESASAAASRPSTDLEFRSMHLLLLVRQAAPDADAEYLAQALLAPLAGDCYAAQRRERGMSPDRIKSGLDHLLRCLDSDREPAR